MPEELQIPENERWLHPPEAKASLDRALAWSEQNEPRESDLNELARLIDSME